MATIELTNSQMASILAKHLPVNYAFIEVDAKWRWANLDRMARGVLHGQPMGAFLDAWRDAESHETRMTFAKLTAILSGETWRWPRQDGED